MKSLPFLSCTCPVYGGVPWLENALHFFLEQKYDGQRELLIVNSFPEQELLGDFPHVRIINLSSRPKSLGALRNIAVKEASGDAIVIWDFDDVFLPNHLAVIGAHYGENQWVWLNRQYWIMGEEIKDIVPGGCPLFSFRKSVWEAVGGYSELTVGEDRQLIGKITEQFTGAKIELAPEEIQFGYRFGQGTYHVSGLGDDRPGLRPAHERVAEAMASRVQRGLEKTGKIVLNPNCPLDWKAKAEFYVKTQELKHVKKNLGDDVAIMLLGRYGDIINALPIARHIAESYGKPHWIVSREFASIFDGVSYVQSVPLDLNNSQIREGLAYANKNFKHVLNAQIWGWQWDQSRECASFNRESWRVCGFGHKFDDRSWRPWFDLRDLKREEAFYRKTNPEGKPMLVVNLRRSVSSPFKDGAQLQDIIKTAFPNLLLVDVADWDLPHLYDLLGLLDRAIACVSIDTFLLHLAACCDVPIIALVNPAPWQGSELRGNEFARVPYNLALHQAIGICAKISEAFILSRRSCLTFHPFERCRSLFHVCERHDELNPKERARKIIAQRSWDELYSTGALIPVLTWGFPRNALTIGDPRPLPYLRDIIKAGLDQAEEDDIVVWTNDDDWLYPSLPEMLRYHCSIWDCCCSSRCEFVDTGIPSSSNKPEVFARNSRSHMGRDLFAATKRWWLSKWDEIPDFILGASDFDLCLCALFRLHFGVKTTRANLEDVMFPADLPRGYVAHQYHPPKWNEPDNRNAAPSQKHNRALFKKWAEKHLPELKFHEDGTI